MNIEDIISKLNWFYSLELNQVELYNSQRDYFKGIYPSQVFDRVSQIEQGHVDNISKLIKDLGGSPSILGDIIAPIIGSIGGSVVSLTGLEETLKINILLEDKAMKDYREFIHALEKENNYVALVKTLQNNYIDEDFHKAWFDSYINKMQKELV